jgi:hypothetical protein
MHPVISADSHVTEPANTYLDHIDGAWRDKAPRMTHLEGARSARRDAAGQSRRRGLSHGSV